MQPTIQLETLITKAKEQTTFKLTETHCMAERRGFKLDELLKGRVNSYVNLFTLLISE